MIYLRTLRADEARRPNGRAAKAEPGRRRRACGAARGAALIPIQPNSAVQKTSPRRPRRTTASSRGSAATRSRSLRSVTVAGRCLPPRVDRVVDRASGKPQRYECHQCDIPCERAASGPVVIEHTSHNLRAHRSRAWPVARTVQMGRPRFLKLDLLHGSGPPKDRHKRTLRPHDPAHYQRRYTAGTRQVHHQSTTGT